MNDRTLVCYWFHKTGRLVANGSIARAGLVATNSIRGGKNRNVLDRIVDDSTIFDAWPDEPWIIDGTAVRVSLICLGASGAELPVRLSGTTAPQINADLTTSTNLTTARRLTSNCSAAYVGIAKGGPFDVPGEQAREWLEEPTNPNGRPNADVLRRWMNGMDVTRRSANKWIVDFGWSMDRKEAALYERPFSYTAANVQPGRNTNRVEKLKRFWWRHERPRPEMYRALKGLPRYIATPTLSKHRLFAWLDARICPDHQLIVIARDDDVTFGIVHSRFHEMWSLRLGTSLEDRPRYTPTTTFETFPFPEGLSPDISADDYADDPRAIVIAQGSRRLVDLRDKWLNPPELVEWVHEPVPGFPKRPVARDETAEKELKKRTLTNLYNARPQWLDNAHAALDAAVAAAYGWPQDIGEDESLEKLLMLNSARERN